MVVETETMMIRTTHIVHTFRARAFHQEEATIHFVATRGVQDTLHPHHMVMVVVAAETEEMEAVPTLVSPHTDLARKHSR